MSDPETKNTAPKAALVSLTQDECAELLMSTPIGRVVFVNEGHPVALPVNYRWHENTVVFRALEGTTMHSAVLEAPVSFEVDRWDEEGRCGSSVVIKGRASEVAEWAEKAQLEELSIVPWAADPWRQTWIRITPTEITGRRTN